MGAQTQFSLRDIGMRLMELSRAHSGIEAQILRTVGPWLQHLGERGYNPDDIVRLAADHQLAERVIAQTRPNPVFEVSDDMDEGGLGRLIHSVYDSFHNPSRGDQILRLFRGNPDAVTELLRPLDARTRSIVIRNYALDGLPKEIQGERAQRFGLSSNQLNRRVAKALEELKAHVRSRYEAVAWHQSNPSISVLGLSREAMAALRRRGINFVQDLLDRSEQDLARDHRIGPEIRKEIKSKLAIRGLELSVL